MFGLFFLGHTIFRRTLKSGKKKGEDQQQQQLPLPIISVEHLTNNSKVLANMVLATSSVKPSDAPAKESKEYCESLAAKIISLADLPAVCKSYDSVNEVLQKRKTINVDPFAGMPGATSARTDRSKGQEHHAKIQRRYTTGATTGTQRFSKLEK